MKASRFPREYRLWLPEEKIFLEGEEITKRGFTLTGDGLPFYMQLPFDCIVQWFSGFIDKNHVKIYEGDICKFNISSGFGSMVESLAIMKWDNGTHQFILHLGAQEAGRVYDAVDTEKIGNEFTHPDLLAKIMEKAKVIG